MQSSRENVRDPLITYEWSSQNSFVESLVFAFESIDYNLDAADTVLYDWIDCNALTQLDWEKHTSLFISTIIWDHQVDITSDKITIYPSQS